MNHSIDARLTIRPLCWSVSLLAIGYLLMAVIGILYTREAGNVAALWPANALLLAVLLRTGRRNWPAYVGACMLANFAANYALGDSVPVACGFAICNLAEVLSAVLLLRHLHPGPWDLVSVPQALSFALVAGIFAPIVAASLGAGLMTWAFQAPYLSVWGVWWVADAMGFLIVTPVVLLATRSRVSALIHQRGGEAIALLVVLALVTFMVFSQSRFPVLYLLGPIMLWAALRIDLLGSAIAALLITMVAVTMTVTGHGPIPPLTESMGERVQFLHLFLAAAVLMPMATAVLFSAMSDTRRALHAEKTRVEITLRSIGEGVITTDARGFVDFINPIAERLTGWSMVEAIGQPVDKVFHVIHALDRTSVVNPVARCLAQTSIAGLDNHIILVGRGGDEYSIQDSVAGIWTVEHELEGVVLVFSDVTERHRLALTAIHDAAHDPLTGLVNRREFERRLQQALDSAEKEDITHALVYLDLDQFKVINDTKGHGAGDELLRQLSHRLNTKTRSRDTFARLGGDEFGLLMERCTLEQARRTTEKLLESVRAFRFVWEGQPFRIGASMGLVAVDGSSRTIAELLRRADAACYGAKERGRDQIHLFTTNDSHITERQGEMHWVSRIQKALEDGQFRLYYQPIVALSESNGDGFRCELLLRL